MATSPFKPFFQKLSDNMGTALYERLSSPFFQSFIVAWISVNWEILYYLISSSVEQKSALDRIKFIQENLITTNQVLWKPLGYSFLFLFAYILLSSLGFFIWEFFLQLKRWIRGRVMQWRPMDEKDEEALRAKIRELDIEKAELIKQFGTNREELQRKITDLQSENNALEVAKSDFEKQIEQVSAEAESFRVDIERLQRTNRELSDSIAEFEIKNAALEDEKAQQLLESFQKEEGALENISHYMFS